MAWSTPRTWVTGELVTSTLLNTEVRDNLSAAFPGGTDFQSWSPSYANLTVGNGTVVSNYFRAGELIVASFQFALGSTSAIGTGPTISWPVAAQLTSNNVVGDAWFLDSGTASYGGQLLVVSSVFTPRVEVATGTYATETTLSSTVPFTWTTGDVLAFTATYQAA